MGCTVKKTNKKNAHNKEASKLQEKVIGSDKTKIELNDHNQRNNDDMNDILQLLPGCVKM